MAHPNNFVNAMRLVGYSFSDMLPAYPGKDEVYLDYLMRDTALASNRFVMPYGLLGTQPCSSEYFNIHPGGFRSNGSQQPWPPNRENTNIFFFGGSTTIGYGLEDRQTVPAQLQRSLRAAGVDCEVYNFGAGSFASRHVALRFLGLLDQGYAPDYAIDLSGVNDSIFGLEPGMTPWIKMLDGLLQHQRRRTRLSWVSAVMDFAMKSRSERRDPSTFHQPVVQSADDPEVEDYLAEDGIKRGLENSSTPLLIDNIGASGVRLAERVWKGYLDSVALFRSAANRNNVKTMFVWQPAPWFKTTPKQRLMERLFYVYRHTVFCSPVYHWLHTQPFPSLQDDPEFINLSGVGESAPGKLYVDIAHYSPSFCEQIAAALASELLTRKWLPVSI